MGRRTSKEGMEYWRQQIELYESSGQTREAYSAEHGIKVHNLDYWRRKLSQRADIPTSGESWIPLRIVEEETSLDLTVGKVRITIRPGFDHELLSEVLRVLAV